jgi:hypothetical protein
MCVYVYVYICSEIYDSEQQRGEAGNKNTAITNLR